jgi:hypothetical protein
MSVKIGKVGGAIVRGYPVYIIEDTKSTYESPNRVNEIFETLHSIRSLTFQYDMRCFICPFNKIDSLKEVLKYEAIPYSTQEEEIETISQDICELKIDEHQVVKYAKIPASGAYCFTFPSSYKNVNNVFCHHPESDYFTNNAEKSGALMETMIWYVPKHHGESILHELKSLMVKTEFKPEKGKDFNDGRWQTKVNNDVIVKITKAHGNMYSVTFDYNEIVLYIIKSIPGRKYFHATKEWLIPAESLITVLDKLRRDKIAVEVQSV